MKTLKPLSADEKYRALVARDSTYDGLFFTGVLTTGIFCRPACPARKPRRENVEFFHDVQEALAAGYRPCLRCRPLEPSGRAPEWVARLLGEVERDPARRRTDEDLRAAGFDPVRVRRWFKTHHGMTFHAYHRARRLGAALGRLRRGDDLTDTAYDQGYESLSGFRDAFAHRFGRTPGRSRESSPAVFRRLLTPLGPMVAAATDEGVCLLEFADRRGLDRQIERLGALLDCAFSPGTHPHLDQTETELERYFRGNLRVFTVPLVIRGTEFQCSVWNRLRQIPYGETRSYARIARETGRPTARRAVGRANGDNRLAILVPCHRVVRSDGQMCGYGGGLHRKRFLLDLERSGPGASLLASPGIANRVPVQADLTA